MYGRKARNYIAAACGALIRGPYHQPLLFYGAIRRCPGLCARRPLGYMMSYWDVMIALRCCRHRDVYDQGHIQGPVSRKVSSLEVHTGVFWSVTLAFSRKIRTRYTYCPNSNKANPLVIGTFKGRICAFGFPDHYLTSSVAMR